MPPWPPTTSAAPHAQLSEAEAALRAYVEQARAERDQVIAAVARGDCGATPALRGPKPHEQAYTAAPRTDTPGGVHEALAQVEAAERAARAELHRQESMEPAGGDHVPADPNVALYCDHIERTEGRARARELRRSVYHSELRDWIAAMEATARRTRPGGVPSISTSRGRRTSGRPRARRRRGQARTRRATRAGPSGPDDGEPSRVARHSAQRLGRGVGA